MIKSPRNVVLDAAAAYLDHAHQVQQSVEARVAERRVQLGVSLGLPMFPAAWRKGL